MDTYCALRLQQMPGNMEETKVRSANGRSNSNEKITPSVKSSAKEKNKVLREQILEGANPVLGVRKVWQVTLRKRHLNEDLNGKCYPPGRDKRGEHFKQREWMACVQAKGASCFHKIEQLLKHRENGKEAPRQGQRRRQDIKKQKKQINDSLGGNNFWSDNDG